MKLEPLGLSLEYVLERQDRFIEEITESFGNMDQGHCGKTFEDLYHGLLGGSYNDQKDRRRLHSFVLRRYPLC